MVPCIPQTLLLIIFSLMRSTAPMLQWIFKCLIPWVGRSTAHDHCQRPPGRHRIDVPRLAPGTYIVHIRSGDTFIKRRVVHMQ